VLQPLPNRAASETTNPIMSVLIRNISMAPNIVIMAAGKGTRMKSAVPKVLHRLAGRSLLQHVLDAAAALGSTADVPHTVVITGHGAEAVEAACAGSGAGFARQMPQLGTGHAVQQALPLLDEARPVTLILNGDVPLIRSSTAAALLQACGGKQLALLTVELADATGYGRIVREGDAVQAIVEHKDASSAQRAIREVYTGIMAAPTAALKRWVMALKNDNAQREYYLTDIVAMAVAEGVPVVAAAATSETEVLGVNSPLQLAELERRFQQQQANGWPTRRASTCAARWPAAAMWRSTSTASSRARCTSATARASAPTAWCAMPGSAPAR
jgi:bifunctional UDP-N-acetylglucosamine pyrophosphorylase / glucosamine-1-phosphate N-acetyltransferase